MRRVLGAYFAQLQTLHRWESPNVALPEAHMTMLMITIQLQLARCLGSDATTNFIRSSPTGSS